MTAHDDDQYRVLHGNTVRARAPKKVTKMFVTHIRFNIEAVQNINDMKG